MAKRKHITNYGGESVWRKGNDLDHVDRPAVSGPRGCFWFRKGWMHRVGGPAFELTTVIPAAKALGYCQNGYFHREDFPALVVYTLLGADRDSLVTIDRKFWAHHGVIFDDELVYQFFKIKYPTFDSVPDEHRHRLDRNRCGAIQSYVKIAEKYAYKNSG
jgi:hypothetical protein